MHQDDEDDSKGTSERVDDAEKDCAKRMSVASVVVVVVLVFRFLCCFVLHQQEDRTGCWITQKCNTVQEIGIE